MKTMKIEDNYILIICSSHSVLSNHLSNYAKLIFKKYIAFYKN